MSESNPRVILIGGASHTGKSTLAAVISRQLGWSLLSTDRLGRHPGRPWSTGDRAVPGHVSDYYLSQQAEELLQDVLKYRRSMWPTIDHIIANRLNSADADPLIVEGAALLPECVSKIESPSVQAVFLTADPELICGRIRSSASYETKEKEERKLIDRFIERSLLFNEHVRRTARLGSVELIDTGVEYAIDQRIAEFARHVKGD